MTNLLNKDITLYAVWILFPFLWLFLIFFGSFFLADIRFIAIALSIMFLAFYLIRRISRKSAYIIAIITLVTIVISFAYGFEESYCWAKGDEAEGKLAGTSAVIIKATKEDAEKLNGAAGMNIKEGSEIGIGFRAHFLCHYDFNLAKALKESYFKWNF